MPSLNGNYIDFAIIVFLLFYLIDKWGRGFLDGVIDLAGFVLSLLLGLKFYSIAASLLISNFSFSRGIANAAGFLFVSLISESLFFMLASYFYRRINIRIIRSRSNEMLGVIPTFISSMILTAFVLTTILVLPIRPDVKQSILTSRIGGFLTRQTLGLERSLSEVFGGAIQETLTFVTVKPEGNENVTLNFKTNDYSVDPASESEMFNLVNKERVDRGFPALVSDTRLRDVGRAHCRDMFARGYFSHYTPDGLSPFDRMSRAGISFRAAGENLAYAPNVQIAHTGLMNSPGHRANILSPDFGRIGIGVIDGGVYGKMFCQEFTD